MSKLLLTAALISALSISHSINAQDNFGAAYTSYTQAIAIKDYAAAVEYAKSAYELAKTKYQDAPENLINLKHNLALAYSGNKQSDEAFSLMKEVVSQNAQHYGELSQEHYFAQVDVLSTLENMDFESILRKKSQIRSLISSATNTANALAETSSEEEAARFYYLLASHLNRGHIVNTYFKQAKKVTEKAEQTLLATAGIKDTRTIEMQFKLGQFNRALKKRRKAVKYFETVVSTVNNAIDTSHPYELASHANLVKLYEDMGESDKATEHCIAIGQMTPWQNDIEQIPLHRVNPRYPVEYAKRGREGVVILTFDIDDYGFVTNPKLVNSSGGSLFVKEAKKALLKWRYAPKVENGKAVESHGHKVQLDFRINS